MPERKRGGWSAYELERLVTLYPRSRESDVARLLRRSVDSVRRKAEELFRRPLVEREWTPEDDLALRLAFGVVELSAIALVLARPLAAVEQRVRELGESRRTGAWTRTELGLLKQLHGSRRDEDLTVCLSRSLEDIRGMAAELCLAKDKRHADETAPPSDRRMPRWSPAEIEYLERAYPTTGNLDLAQALGRSVVSVANKASQLGLRKSGDLRARVGRRNVEVRHRRNRDGDAV